MITYNAIVLLPVPEAAGDCAGRGLQLLTAVWEAAEGLVHEWGREPVQGRGLFENRHVAHPASPPPPCRKFTMEPAPSPWPAPSTAAQVPSQAPDALRPVPPVVSVALNLHCCRGAWDLCQESLIPGGRHRVGPPVLGPAATHQSSRMQWHSALPGVTEPPCTPSRFLYPPHTLPRRASAVPPPPPGPLPAFQSIAIIWPMLCRFSSPSAAAAAGNRGCSSLLSV